MAMTVWFDAIVDAVGELGNWRFANGTKHDWISLRLIPNDVQDLLHFTYEVDTQASALPFIPLGRLREFSSRGRTKKDR
jgi:hypothetical protein